MGKAPAFQFYVRDWLSDPQLQSASASTRGIWINALCYMWEAETRGVLMGTTASFCRLLGASEKEIELFFHEATELNFADVTICNGKVTLINRRMEREEKERENIKKRVAKHREKRNCNEEVTAPSSSSSSSSLFLSTKTKESTKENVAAENVAAENVAERPRDVRSAHPSFAKKDFEPVMEGEAPGSDAAVMPEPIRYKQAGRRGKKPSTRAAPFRPPTADEVRDYCTERGNGVNPQVFCDFYAAKGWKIGNSPMKNWQAAVRTWEVRGAERMPQRTPARASPQQPMTLREAQFWDREQIALESIRKREEENAKNSSGNNQELGHEIPQLRLLAGTTG